MKVSKIAWETITAHYSNGRKFCAADIAAKSPLTVQQVHTALNWMRKDQKRYPLENPKRNMWRVLGEQKVRAVRVPKPITNTLVVELTPAQAAVVKEALAILIDTQLVDA